MPRVRVRRVVPSPVRSSRSFDGRLDIGPERDDAVARSCPEDEEAQDAQRLQRHHALMFVLADPAVDVVATRHQRVLYLAAQTYALPGRDPLVERSGEAGDDHPLLAEHMEHEYRGRELARR